MYEYFHGLLVEKNASYVVVEINGIGYKLHIPVNLMDKLPHNGEKTFFYVSWVIRENSQTLYAFMKKEERDLFELLLTLSGIGPKTALSLVGHFELEDFKAIVQKEDSKSLAHAPGIGKKTAERLIVDLKDKLKFSTHSKTQFSSKTQDALNALMHLGCSESNAEIAIKKATEELTDECDLSALITAALKYQK